MRHVIRELARLTRDLLLVGLDPSRLEDPEIAAESERDRIRALAALFSSEDLMRAFDVLTKADYDIRGSTQPRYHLELALLRWIHLRRLVPLTDIIQGLEKGSRVAAARDASPRQHVPSSCARRLEAGRRSRRVERRDRARRRDQARRGDGREGRSRSEPPRPPPPRRSA